METRIIQHFNVNSDSTWWRVDVKQTVFRLGKFRIWKWKTIGDYSHIVCADLVSKAIKRLED